MSSGGWLRGVRTGLSLRNRTRTIGVRPSTLPSVEIVAGWESRFIGDLPDRGLVGSTIWRRGYQSQAAMREENEDEYEGAGSWDDARNEKDTYDRSDERPSSHPTTWRRDVDHGTQGRSQVIQLQHSSSSRVRINTSRNENPTSDDTPSPPTAPLQHQTTSRLPIPIPTSSDPSKSDNHNPIASTPSLDLEATEAVVISLALAKAESPSSDPSGPSSEKDGSSAILEELFLEKKGEGVSFGEERGSWAQDTDGVGINPSSGGEEKRTRAGDGKMDGSKVVSTPAIQAARLVIGTLDPSNYSSSTTISSYTLLTIFRRLHDDHLRTLINARQRGRPRTFLQSTTDVPDTLQASLDLMDALRGVRQRRKRSMYEALINHCVIARRPDLAATVYVGLVEEWIMEGRLAEGGSPDEFREGGGPIRLARSKEEEEEKRIKYSVAAEVNGWFEGVRSWRFPGEKLTPSQRLDLWHPRKLALHEKLKGFPIPSPTSPPTLVPQPNLDCLKRVLAGVKLDGYQDDPLLYKRSARALATLANTVLSRTLPIMGLGCLLDAFKKMDYNQPEVYPEGFVPPLDCSDTYPYTAYAHTYRANMSLTLTPPALTQMVGAALYKLPPLNTHSCNRLIHWVMTVVKEPSYRTHLFEYMRKGKKGGLARLNTVTYNTVFRGATLLRDNKLADDIRGILFGRGHTAAQAVAAVGLGSGGTNALTAKDKAGFFGTNARTDSSAKPQQDQQDLRAAVTPDEFSMSTNIAHLTVTNNFEEITRIAYGLYPFLDTDKYPNIKADATAAEIEAERRRRGKMAQVVTQHSTHTFSACLHALHRCRRVNLAGRLYQLGRQCDADPALGWRLPIQAYTTMLDLYAEVSDRALSTTARTGRGQITRKERSRKVFRDAFRAIGSKEDYDRARSERSSDLDTRPIPDWRFFEAFLRSVDVDIPVAPAGHLGLGRVINNASDALFQLEMVIHTADLWDVPIPDHWAEKQDSLRVAIDSLEVEREHRLLKAVNSASVTDAPRRVELEAQARSRKVKLSALVLRHEGWLWPEFRQSLDEFLPPSLRTGQRVWRSRRLVDVRKTARESGRAE